LDLAIDVTTAAKRMQNSKAVEANLRSTQGQYVTGDAMIAIIMLPPEARIELISARALATASRLSVGSNVFPFHQRPASMLVAQATTRCNFCAMSGLIAPSSV